MILSWRVGGFKSIGAETDLRLAPLTLLCGANSSGKSSLLQSVLLLSQSTSARVGQDPVVLNGSRVQLGDFRDVSHRQATKRVHVGLDLEVQGSAPGEESLPASLPLWNDVAQEGPSSLRAGFDVSFGRPNLGDRSPPLILDLRLAVDAPDGQGAVLRVKRRASGRAPVLNLPSATSPAVVLGTRDYIIELDDAFSFDAPVTSRLFAGRDDKIMGVELQGMIPTGLWLTFDRVLSAVEQTLGRVLLRSLGSASVAAALDRIRGEEAGTYVDLFFRQADVAKLVGPKDAARSTLETIRALNPSQRRELVGLVPRFLEHEVQTRPGAVLSFARRPLPQSLAVAAQAVARHAGGVRRLGPLRQPPQPIYRGSSAADVADVGEQGEYTASVLHRFATLPVRHQWDGAVKEEPLQRAVDRWMTHLGIHSSVVSRELGNLGHVLGIFDDAVPVPMDLTQVGVGVSQVLPVLVQALLTPPGGTLLLEQPELHLHPAVQSRLADFLVAACCEDRQILCETHSEYLVARLRILTAERPEMRAGFLRIYFAARIGANTQFEEVRVDDRGRIDNWPRGFFDQSALDSARMLEMDLAR